MNSAMISRRIETKIKELECIENSIVVLKGIPLSLVDKAVNKVNLQEAIDNKLAYFININKNNRKYLTYEEFLLIGDFIVSQYKEVYLLKNNIYMNQYPIEECFPDNVRKGLLLHFGESELYEEDDSYIGDIDEYISIFDGIKEYNGYLLGSYCWNPVLSSTKVIEVNLFENEMEELTNISFDNDEDIECDIVDESDYIDFVKKLFAAPDEIIIRITNYTGDINKLKNHIKTIAFYWKEYSDVICVQTAAVKSDFEHRKEYSEILEKYWGYSSFRNLSVYDMDKLDKGEKHVVQVSQEKIISNIVEQVENCGENKDFRDIFVTAPTGAGKSVMFQLPAIYLAEKYDLLTIVISPLIGLMNDQVKNLELKKYNHAKTINSDVSPILKQEIIGKVADGQYHILYISPETLLSRSDLEQLIGNRTIGMIVIDEAHIVTTWGKQFRPDYWYLGNHIRKLRKMQIDNPQKRRSFVITTFTATAIFQGLEDMYTETINSLHMLNPITYLGYVKRNDIDIVIDNSRKEKGERREYELDKFEQIESIIKRAIITNKKTLIYFPTVALIDRCYEYLRSIRMVEKVTFYYGTLNKENKSENYENFYSKNKLVMLATKAFGMGIDINDIELVVHFAPTGNVCDYVQEIGRAARKEGLKGEAYYHYNPKDFKHINRLHGLSTIRHYQLIKVVEKIVELYQSSIHGERRKDYSKKRNTMLLDAENFTYIFGSAISDEDNSVNKVKTALLLIQKDFEAKVGFSPIQVRPISMFSIGFFKINPEIQYKLNRIYPGSVLEIDTHKHICKVMLSIIWNSDYKHLSFPKFKYEIYSKSKDLKFINENPITPALRVKVEFAHDYLSEFENIWGVVKRFIIQKVQLSEHTAISEIVDSMVTDCKINKYKAQAICEVIIASMDSYRKRFAKSSSPIVQEKTTTSGTTKYQFNVAVNSYFKWVENGMKSIELEVCEGELYLIEDSGSKINEYSIFLGILEAIGCLSFEMLGGANSQLYIYINQIQTLKNIINAPNRYKNRLLDTISERHLISVKMLTYLYESNSKSNEIWNIIEDYFLGVIPEKVIRECKNEKPDIIFN